MPHKSLNLTTAGFAAFIAGLFLPYALGTAFLVIFLILVLIDSKSGIQLQKLKHPFYLFQCLFWITTAVSLLWTTNMSSGIDEAVRKLPFLVVPLILAGKEAVLKQSKNGILDIIWLSGILVSIICIARVLATSVADNVFDDLVYENLSRASGIQPIYLSFYMILATIAWYFRFIFEKPVKIWKWAVPLFFYAMVIMLSSRTELMVFIVVSSVVLLYHAWAKKQFVGAVAGGALMVFLAVLLINQNPVNQTRFSGITDVNANYEDQQWGGTSLRLEKWKNTLETYRQFPVLGTGAGDYSDELFKTYRKNNFNVAIENGYNSHNQYLQTLLTLGVLGLSSLVGFFLTMLATAWKKKDLALLLILAAVSLSMLTESLIERQMGLFICIAIPNIFYAFALGGSDTKG